MSRTDPRPKYGSGRRVRPDGYVDLWRPRHPLARSDGYVFEHRLVIYEAGVSFPYGFEIHHIDEDRGNNRLDNLAVVTSVAHRRLHHPEGSVVRNQHGEGVVGQGITRQYRERKAALGDRVCAACGEDISGRRVDARFCSQTCRHAAWKAAI